MAKKNVHQFERRRREQARQEKAAARRARKRAGGSSGPAPDADLEGIVAGPQDRDLASDAEVLAAVERAMNPGAIRKRGARQRPDQPVCRRLFVGNLDFGTDEQELRELLDWGRAEVGVVFPSGLARDLANPAVTGQVKVVVNGANSLVGSAGIRSAVTST